MKAFQNTFKAINNSMLQTDWWKAVCYLEVKFQVTTWLGAGGD